MYRSGVGLGFLLLSPSLPRENEGRIQMNNPKWIFTGLCGSWSDDTAPPEGYIGLRIDGDGFSIDLPHIGISWKDLERLARASDAAGYLSDFLSGEEICSHSCHYPHPEEPPKCNCNQEEGGE